MRRLLGVLSLLVFSLLVSIPASAQIEQGRLTGIVKDNSGGVLPGVTVTVTSPALIGQRTTITEADGRYLITSLPSGAYIVKFELAGFQTMERTGIRLTQGSTLSIDMDLQVATLNETVTVTGESPVIDTTSTKVGAEFSGEALVGIPSSTDLWGALAQTPGVRMRGYDVGGSHKSQQNNYEAFGIRGQNKVLFEGIDATEGDSGGFFYSDYFAVDEVAITAVGGDVEMSSPGTAIVQNYKSGGNKFSGIENFTFEPGSFVGNNVTSDLAQRGFTGNPNLMFYEYHLDLGGPILKDKLWFYGAYNWFKIDKAISGIPTSVATDSSILEDPLVKLTWKATEKDTVIGYYQPRNYKRKPNRNLSASVSPEAVLAQASKTWIKKIGWQRVWSNRLFMDMRAAACCEIWPMTTKVDATTHPARLDQATQLQTGAGWDAFTLAYQKPQGAATFTYFLPTAHGSHDMKFGGEFISNRYQQGINGQSGPVRYLDRNGAVDQIMLIDVGTFEEFGDTWNPSFTSNRMFAAFLQDRWTPSSRLTLTAGVRFGYQRPYFEEGKRNPVLKEIFPELTVPERVLFTSTNWAPRVGMAYDLTGDDKTALKLFWGRYYAIYGNNFNSANPGGVNSKTFQFLDQNRNRLYDGPQELGTLVAATGGSSTTVDPDLKQPYADEVSASIERQFWGESSVRAVYVHKTTHNVYGVTNSARYGNINVPVTVANPFAPGQTINALDIPDSLRGVVRNRFMTIPEADSTYDTISVSGQKRFAKGLFVQGSYDFQWRDEIRQADNISTSPLNTDPIGVFGYGATWTLDYSADVRARQSNTNWQARVLGRYEFPFGVSFGANYRLQNGFPYAPVASIRLPNAGTQRVLVDNVSSNRSQTVPILDLRLDKAFTFRGVKLQGLLDLYNVTNNNAVTNFFLVSGSTYNRVIAALDPRAMQMGLRISF